MASEIRVNKIINRSGLSTVTFSDTGAIASGIVTATSFSGNLPAAQLTGTLPAISGANLTSLPSQATIANNADNRLITGGSGVNLNGEANLTFSSNQLTVHTAKLKGNQLLFEPSGTAYIDHSTVGQDIQVRVSTSSSNDTTGPKFRSDGNIETASNKGIYFGSSNANNFFDSYEEGTFTPTILNGWGILNSNPQISTGKYIRTGAIVYIYFTFKEGSGTGASFNGNRLSLYTFPFNPDGTFGSGGGNNFSHPLEAYTNSNSSGGENVIGVPGSNGATVFSFITKASNGYGSFTGSDLGTSGQIFCAGTYRITGT